MSKSPGLTIPSIDFQRIEQAVEATAKERGLPKQTYPSAVPPPVPEVVSVPVAATPRLASKKKRSTMRFTVDMPDYIAQQIYARASSTMPRSTAKSVMFAALRAYGLRVDDEDLVPDGRRPSRI